MERQRRSWNAGNSGPRGYRRRIWKFANDVMGLTTLLAVWDFLTRRFRYDVYGLGYVWNQVVVTFQLINLTFILLTPTKSGKMGTATMKTVSKKPFYLQTGNPISHLSIPLPPLFVKKELMSSVWSICLLPTYRCLCLARQFTGPNGDLGGWW
jgi:hypothetical protein